MPHPEEATCKTVVRISFITQRRYNFLNSGLGFSYTGTDLFVRRIQGGRKSTTKSVQKGKVSQRESQRQQ